MAHGRTEAHVEAGAEQEPKWGGLEVWLGHETVGWLKEKKNLVLNQTWKSKLEVKRKKRQCCLRTPSRHEQQWVFMRAVCIN